MVNEINKISKELMNKMTYLTSAQVRQSITHNSMWRGVVKIETTDF